MNFPNRLKNLSFFFSIKYFIICVCVSDDRHQMRRKNSIDCVTTRRKRDRRPTFRRKSFICVCARSVAAIRVYVRVSSACMCVCVCVFVCVFYCGTFSAITSVRDRYCLRHRSGQAGGRQNTRQQRTGAKIREQKNPNRLNPSDTWTCTL